LLAGVKNFAQVTALRILLGLFEASNYGCLTLITSMYFTQREQGIRIAIWVCTNGVLPIIFIMIYWCAPRVSRPRYGPDPGAGVSATSPMPPSPPGASCALRRRLPLLSVS
jgi:MFS family permease